MISKIIIGIFAALLVGAPGAFPQETLPVAASREAKAADKPVILGEQTLFHLTTEAEGLTIAKRAREVSKRIKRIADSPTFKVDAITTNDLKTPMTFIVVGDEIVTAVLDQDAALTGKSRQQVAAEYAQTIRTAIEKYRRDRSLKQLIYNAVYTLVATIIFIAILILMGKFKHKIDQRIEERFKAWKKGINIQSFELVRAEKSVKCSREA